MCDIRIEECDPKCPVHFPGDPMNFSSFPLWMRTQHLNMTSKVKRGDWLERLPLSLWRFFTFSFENVYSCFILQFVQLALDALIKYLI